MYPTARRRRRRANINTFRGSTVRRKPKCWPIEQLCDVDDPTVDVAPDVIRIVPLHFSGTERVRGKDGITESRSEAFDLAGYRFRHVVGPSGVLARGCPRCIEQALLGK